MNIKDVLKELKKHILKDAGKRCEKESHWCYTCRMWGLYDSLVEAFL